MAEPAEEDCIHGLVKAWCSLCRASQRPAPKEFIERTFSARYHSNCPQCRELIEPGDTVHMLTSGSVVHQECP